MKRSRTIYDGLCELNSSSEIGGYALQRNRSLDSLIMKPTPLSPGSPPGPNTLAKKSKISASHHAFSPRESLLGGARPELEPMEGHRGPRSLHMSGVANLIPFILPSEGDTLATSSPKPKPQAAENKVRAVASHDPIIFVGTPLAKRERDDGSNLDLTSS